MEEAFDVFDMESTDGMHAILSSHIAAIGRLLPGLSSTPVYKNEIERLRALAMASRQALDLPQATEAVRPHRQLHPLAIAYVVLGSRLGARVLSRRLDRQEKQWDPAVRGYFTDESSGPAWALLCSELEALTPDDEIEVIANDAQRVFALFGEEARARAPARSLANA
ncbi:hypothetical protein [Qipengyuania gaetbuli]|uniref:hypothetical protein n=1 Tax=Qipengyuania gaetbuli TaxID=266952 RepID=UPI001CD76CA5|nr:hypothetical protein [Qipengyuania gaetbuli]MCA0911215.1 hypothetical protein [Qipengyuania gaetbuli]